MSTHTGPRKISVGWVTQFYDAQTGKCVEQEFTAGDDVVWEDENGDPVEPPQNEVYFPYDMRQPENHDQNS